MTTLKLKPRKHETNEEFIRRVMNFSPVGALSQIFVIEAIRSYSKAISEAKPEETGNALISGEAWVAAGKWMHEEIEKHLDPRK